MASLSKIILYLSATVFFFGQLMRIEFNGIIFPLFDLFIVALAIINFFNHLLNGSLKIKNRFFLFFLIYCWFNLIINLYLRQLNWIKPTFYLLRLTALLTFFILPLGQKIIDTGFQKFFRLIIISNIAFAFIQYFFWPDLAYFKALNWDPHLYRLVGTLLDPTFTALIFGLFLLNNFLSEKNRKVATILVSLSYLAIALSYSRATLLALLLSMAYIAIKKRRVFIFFFFLIIEIATIFLLPRLPGEGTKLERTSSIKAKIDNYIEAYQLSSKSLLFGFGYNTLEQVRDKTLTGSHANNGFDGSLATITVTTGILGLFIFIAGLAAEFRHSHLVGKSLWLLILIHSLFANSLLYPWVLIYLVFINSRK